MEQSTAIKIVDIVTKKLAITCPDLNPQWVELWAESEGQTRFNIYPNNLYTAALFYGVLLPAPIQCSKSLSLAQYGFPGHYLWFGSWNDYHHTHLQKRFLSITITDENAT